MLNRLAARAIQSNVRRTCQHDVTTLSFTRTYASETYKNSNGLRNHLEKRLKSISSSLDLQQPLSPASKNEFERWRVSVKARDFDVAMKLCGENIYRAPSWLLLYLLDSKVYTPAQAVTAVNVMLQYSLKADNDLQCILLLLTVRFLARRQVEAPVPDLINRFLLLDIPNPSKQFNLLLRNLSHFKPSPILAKATTNILDAMHGRQIRLHSRTYRSLLSNSLVTLELAKRLQLTMELEGTTPNRHHLEAYLRVFAHHGAVHASARYLNLIRERAEQTDAEWEPHGVELTSQGARPVKSETSVTTRWNTEFLKSFKRNTGSAFQYLRELVADEDFLPAAGSAPRKENRLSSFKKKTRPLIWKHEINVWDWVTVLNVAARDPKISGERLLQLFDKTHAAVGYPPTVPVFTVLVRGLARKGDHATALQVWERCCASWPRRRKIDTMALTVAMDVLVSCGYHLEAFDTLVETTGILHSKEQKSTKLNDTAIGRRYRRALFSKYAKIDVPLVNALMNAYQKNGRQDLVFELWDVFTPLFGVYPNAETLTVVLDAAYAVSRWDHTFRGLLEHLGLHNLFEHHRSGSFSPAEKSKQQIVQHMWSTIRKGEPSRNSKSKSGTRHDESTDMDAREVVNEAKTYLRKTLWGNELAAPKAMRLFREILLGNFPELEGVVPPARAVWPDEATRTSPVRDAIGAMGSKLGLLGTTTNPDPDPNPNPTPTPPQQTPPPADSELSIAPSSSSSPSPSPLPTSPHPQISPTPLLFSSYILLLSSTHQPSLIAHTLAYMRQLHIRPLSSSLALSLALWSEASVRGPFLEWVGGKEGSEYERLHGWLVEWLGEEGVPSVEKVMWAFRKLKAEREK